MELCLFDFVSLISGVSSFVLVTIIIIVMDVNLGGRIVVIVTSFVC